MAQACNLKASSEVSLIVSNENDENNIVFAAWFKNTKSYADIEPSITTQPFSLYRDE